MSDLLTEVDEMMRQERMAALWKQHGGKLVAVIAALIIGTGAFSAYQAWNKRVQIEDTNAVLEYKQDINFPENINAEQEFDMRAAPRAITLLTAAAAYLTDGDAPAALALYQSVEEDEATPNNLRDMAQLHIARLSDESVEKRLGRLNQITGNTNSPWRYHAHLEAAVILANEAQDYEQAITHLNAIMDTPNLPDTLYAKARALMQVYTLEQKDGGHE